MARRHRLVLAASKLNERQLRDLADLLNAQAALVYIEGEAYMVRKGYACYMVHRLQGGEEHTVRGTGCSCPDSRFRGRVCKHAAALANVFGA